MSGPAEKTAAASVGERLRAARDRQGLTLQKISEDLHLDVPMLEAMEENRFRALGAPVYARGHLRKYAGLLGLDVSGVLADYEAAHSGPVEPKLVAAPTVQVEVVAQPPAGAAHADLAPPIEPATVKPPAAAAPGVITPAPVGVRAATARLGLRFVAPSWVEIYDATGARLMFDERDAASARTVLGVPPFKVLLGNYDGVELTLNGRAVQIPQRARYGATARFRVMADGATLSSWSAE
jgi:cytoskeletal protein RodZ